jgi:hypothetical protein
MKKILFPILLFILTCSCNDDPYNISIPKGILPSDTMISILIDVHLIEGAIAHANVPRDSALLLYALYEKDLYQKHKINDSIYKTSYKFYSEHPLILNRMYDKVIDSLNLREGQRRL